MKTLLVVNSSPRSQSVSRKLTRLFTEQWKAQNPDGQVIERDLAADALPYVDEAWIHAVYTPEDQRTAQQKETLRLSDKLIDEIMKADVIVLGIPMHNFTIPAMLKAWFDQITRAGKTFSYGANGPEGLVPQGKKVVAVVSRGGAYPLNSPYAAFDFQVPYVRHMLAFIGLTDVTFVDADKQAMGAEIAQQSVELAENHINSLAQHLASQAVA